MSRYLKNKVYKNYEWGVLQCVNKEEVPREFKDGAITIKTTEEQFTIHCQCGNTYEKWFSEFDPKALDCGCGLWARVQEADEQERRRFKRRGRRPLLGSQRRIMQAISMDQDVLAEMWDYAEDHKISLSEATNRLVQLGLRDAKVIDKVTKTNT